MIKTLLITGSLMPMHNFRRTHELLRTVFEASGHFKMNIMENPEGITSETLSNYDLVVMNYDGMRDSVTLGPRNLAMAPGERKTKLFGETTLNALYDFVGKGKGIFFYHTAACVTREQFPEEYVRLVGAESKRQKYKAHRELGYSVNVNKALGHVITDGVDDEWKIADDDFLNGIEVLEGTALLATIYDPVNDRPAPVMWACEYGKGRSFATTLGHQEDTIRRLNFVRMMLRGSDWAANGTIAVPMPDRDTSGNWMKGWPWYY